jgi:hypothetical protein
VSAPSPATGADAPPTRKGERAGARRSAGESTFHVSLESGRWRHLAWIVASAAIGALLLWKLGVVGKAVGAVMLAVGVLHVVRFVRTLLNPAGRIELRDDGVVLPVGLCRPGATTVPYEELRHAFFLRRAVPWSRTGPILVIEAADQAFTYPRDWFSSDSDQRRVALALNRRLGRI